MSDMPDQQIKLNIQKADEENESLIEAVGPHVEDDSLLDDDFLDPNTKCYGCKRTLRCLDRIDKRASAYIFQFSGGKVIDVLIAIPCLAFSYFGFPLWIIFYMIILESYLYALCVLVSIVVTQIMKRCFKRKRPRKSDLGHRWFYLDFEDVSAEHSFPSGDTSQSAVFAVTLGYSLNPDYFWCLCFTPFVALGRIYFGRHYIGDTIFGGLTGVAVGYCVNYFLVHHMYRISNYTSLTS